MSTDNQPPSAKESVKEKRNEGGPIKVHAFALPVGLTFANEAVPLIQPDVAERLDREIHVNTYFHSNTIFLMKRAHRWFPMIEPVLAAHNIPADFKYLAVIESDLKNVVSHAGATGFWQFKKGTARDYGLEVSTDVDERYHPIKSTEAACLYLKDAYSNFATWTDAAASYNMGMTGFKRRLTEQRADSYYDLLLNNETSRYVFRILAVKEIFESPQKYGYDFPEGLLYDMDDTKELEVNKSIDDLVTFAKTHGCSYKTLKRLNPWLRTKQLRVKNKKSYVITLPA